MQYTALEMLAESPVKILYPPPVLMLLLAAVIEAWCILVRLPGFRSLGLREPEPPLYFLQPACFDAAICSIIDDSDARKSPADGGIGYRGGCTTMEGICQQIADWNRGLADVSGAAPSVSVLDAVPEPAARKA